MGKAVGAGTLIVIVAATVARAAPPPQRPATPTPRNRRRDAARRRGRARQRWRHVFEHRQPADAPDRAFVPDDVPNERLLEGQDSPSFTAAIDPQVTRPAGGAANAAPLRRARAAAVIRALTTPRGIAGRFMSVPAKPLRGRKIRISGWLKTADLQNWAGLAVAVMGPDGRCDAST
jgi:hypothetical protein